MNFKAREQEIQYYKNLDPKKKDQRQQKVVKQALERIRKSEVKNNGISNSRTPTIT